MNPITDEAAAALGTHREQGRFAKGVATFSTSIPWVLSMLGSLFSRRKSVETPQGDDHDIRKTSMLRGRFRMRRG